jgi:hypothetical protein
MSLAVSVLQALEARDTDRLRALALDQTEFQNHVWPELPAAAPQRNLPWSYVWRELHQKSEASLGRTVASAGGRRYELVSVQFAGGTTPYKTYMVHRKAILTVTSSDGTRSQLRAFGSVIEKDGRFKVFSYVADD